MQNGKRKSGSREAATTLALFNAILIVWGAGWDVKPAVDFANELVPYTVGTLTIAFGGKKVEQVREERKPWSEGDSK